MASSKRDYKFLIAVGLMCFILGGIIGFYFGVDLVIRKATSMASIFIDIDYETIKQALFQYNNHIMACWGNTTLS